MSKRLIQNRFKSKVDFRTPQYIFEGIQDELGIVFHLDVAASTENRLCNWYYTEDDNALEQRWWGRVWCNPPYNNIGSWVDKAIEELNEGRCLSVTFLVPASTCTFWFEKLWHRASNIIFLSGRTKFEGPNSIKHKGGTFSAATNPSVVIHLKKPVNHYMWRGWPPNVELVNTRNGEWG